MKKLFTLAAALVVSAGSAHAAAVFSFTEQGTDLVGILSGSVDLVNAMKRSNPGPSYNQLIAPRFPALQATPGDADNGIQGQFYQLTGAPSFGTGGIAYGSSVGDAFELRGDRVLFDVRYQGGLLANTLTFDNTSLASLGITAGDYTYTLLGSNDTVTLRFAEAEAATVPLPGTLSLVGAGLFGLGFTRRRRSGDVRDARV